MNITCTIKHCEKVTKNGQLVCPTHYSRWRRHGSYEISSNWNNLKKGQALITPLGYLRINIGGKRILHHRHVMEQHLGRKLKPKEKIHHLNGDKTDNRIENLVLCKTHSEHIRKFHSDNWRNRQLYPPVPENIKKEILEIANNHVRTRNKAQQICKVSTCSNPMRSKSLCHKHMVWYFKNRYY